MILIIRARRQSVETQEQLRLRGRQDIFIEPVLELKPVAVVDWPDANPSEFLLIITSINAFENSGVLRYKEHNLVTIGRVIPEVARGLGFQNVVSAGVNMDEMLHYLRLINKPKRVLYLRAKDVSQDLEVALKGFEVNQRVVYKMDAVDKFSAECAHLIAQGVISKVMLYSKRSAEIFFDLVAKSGLTEHCQLIEFCALSNRVAEVIPCGCLVKVAGSPDQDAMVDLVAS